MIFGCRKTTLKMKKIREMLKKVSKSGVRGTSRKTVVSARNLYLFYSESQNLQRFLKNGEPIFFSPYFFQKNFF